jgi:hypothetical protein
LHMAIYPDSELPLLLPNPDSRQGAIVCHVQLL